MTVSVLWLFLMRSWVGLQCVIKTIPGHTQLLFFFHLQVDKIFREDGSQVMALKRDPSFPR